MEKSIRTRLPIIYMKIRLTSWALALTMIIAAVVTINIYKTLTSPALTEIQKAKREGRPTNPLGEPPKDKGCPYGIDLINNAVVVQVRPTPEGNGAYAMNSSYYKAETIYPENANADQIAGMVRIICREYAKEEKEMLERQAKRDSLQIEVNQKFLNR